MQRWPDWFSRARRPACWPCAAAPWTSSSWSEWGPRSGSSPRASPTSRCSDDGDDGDDGSASDGQDVTPRRLSDEAQISHGVLLVGELGHGGVDAVAGEVVDLE